MKERKLSLALLCLVLPVGVLLFWMTLPGLTRICLVEPASGRKILSEVLRDKEEIVMTWKNSLFGLEVTEVYQAQGGVLLLTQISFADPLSSSAPPRVSPADVEDLYQTGGAFYAKGLRKSFQHIVYRVGEIGDPRMRVRGKEVRFSQEVGFGGRIMLSAGALKLRETLLENSSP